MARSKSPSSSDQGDRNKLRGKPFPLPQQVFWFDLCLAAAVDIVKKNPTADWETQNEQFREQQTKLRKEHRSVFDLTPDQHTTRRYAKQFQSQALRNVPKMIFWQVLSEHVLSPDKHSINLFHRCRDEIRKGFTKGMMHQIVEDIRKQGGDIHHATYDTEQGSTNKYRVGDPTVYHDRLLLKKLIKMQVATSQEVAPKIEPKNELDDSDSDDHSSTVPPAAVGRKFTTTTTSVVTAATRAFLPSSGLEERQSTIDVTKARKATTVYLPDKHIAHSFCFGNRMPQIIHSDGSISPPCACESNQCLALSISAYIGIDVCEVRGEMKSCSMAFTTTKSYSNLVTSQQSICSDVGYMGSMVDISFLRYYSLPCLRGVDFVVVTHNVDGTNDDTYNIDCFCNIAGTIGDNAVVLLLRHEHYTVLKLDTSVFESAAGFVMAMDRAVVVAFHAISKCFPSEATTDGCTTPTPSSRHSPPGSPGSATAPVTITGGTDSDSCVVDEDATPTPEKSFVKLELFMHARGKHHGRHEPGYDKDPILDAPDSSTYKAKCTYLGQFMNSRQGDKSGAHQEAHNKVVKSKDKKEQLAVKAANAASVPKAYLAGKAPKNLAEKALVLTQMIKDGPGPVCYDTDTGEELTLVKIDKRCENGKMLCGFFKDSTGKPVTFNAARVANAPYPRQDHDLAFTMYKFGMDTNGRKMDAGVLSKIKEGRSQKSAVAKSKRDVEDAGAASKYKRQQDRHDKEDGNKNKKQKK